MQYVLCIRQIGTLREAVVANFLPRQHNPGLPQCDLARCHCGLVLPIDLNLICRHKPIALLHPHVPGEEERALGDFTVVCRYLQIGLGGEYIDIYGCERIDEFSRTLAAAKIGLGLRHNREGLPIRQWDDPYLDQLGCPQRVSEQTP